MISNRKGREFAMQNLYAIEMGQNDLDYFQKDVAGILKVDDRAKKFGKKLVQYTVDNLDEIDSLISEHSNNWDLNRMAVLDKIILRFSLAEIKYMKNALVKVCITEAVQLAKKYSDLKSPVFINGVLDSIIKKKLTGKKV